MHAFLKCSVLFERSRVGVQGVRHILKLNGSESLTECNRELCGVQDCCGDKAYVVTVQSVDGAAHGKRKRRPSCACACGLLLLSVPVESPH